MAADNDNDRRIERLIAAQEAQTNALNRLIQLLENKRVRGEKGKATRMRNVSAAKPIAVSPLVRASVDRALKKAGVK